jgi:predicted lipoprotein with Yx(FWY)xxD motif
MWRPINGIIAAAVLFGALPNLASAAEPADAGAPARIEMTDDGPIFVTPAGMTLYTLGADDPTPGKSVCLTKPLDDFADPTAGFGRMKIPGYQYAAACAAMSPPFLASAAAKPTGEWSLFQRPEGGQQWVYRSKPLYTSVRDRQPGDRNGIALDQGRRRGLSLAAAPWGGPAGLDVMRRGDDLVLATDNRPLFTPRGARMQKSCLQCGDDMKPLLAPELLRVDRPWSVVEGGAGQRQFAFAGKPLFTAEALGEADVLASGNWDLVVVRKGAGKPPAIATTYTPTIGDIYTTREGRTLYIFTCTSPNETVTAPGCDRPGGPAAYWAALCGSGEECSRRWRPYAAATDAKPSAEWSVVEVSDPMFFDPAGTTYPAGAKRVRAWAYRGHPVYTFYEDQAKGDIWGHMLRWFSMSGFLALPVPGMATTP